MKFLLIFFFVCTALDTWCQEFEVAQNEVLELEFQSTKPYTNPYQEIELKVAFKNDAGESIEIPAFWAGGSVWKVRFSSPTVGSYQYHSNCSDRKNKGLHQQSGAFLVVPYIGNNTLFLKGGIIIENQRIIHRDGSPFLWLADSWWHGMTTRLSWPHDYQLLAKDRKDKGFSVIQLAVGFPCDITPFDPRGSNEAGFPTDQDYTTINPDYFDLVDLRIQYLVEQGLMPNILGTWGYYLPWFGIENMKRYWNHLIARYAAYPVSWTVAGETTLTYYLTEPQLQDSVQEFQKKGWSEIAGYIKEIDPYQRIMAAHPGPNSGGFEAITDADQLDLIMVQPGHSGWESLPRALNHLNTARSKYYEKPVMQGEVCFEGMFGGGCDAKLQRLLFWTNMLSGAAGHCYGADAIWQFNSEDELFGASPSGHTWGNFTWQEAYRWQGSFYVGLGRKILEKYDWQNFQVNPHWVNTHDPEDVLSPYAAGIPGKVRLCYFPKGLAPWGVKNKIRNLEQNRSYSITYIDPMTGTRYPSGTVTGISEWTVEPAPILQDWLVELKTLAL